MSDGTPTTPAGWYPQGEQLRYWDGSAWTEHTAPLPPQAPLVLPSPNKKAEREAQRRAGAEARAQGDAIKSERRAQQEAEKAAKRQEHERARAVRREEDEAARALKRDEESSSTAKRAADEAAQASKLGDGVRPDIAAAMGKMSYKMGSKREIKRLPEHLWENERVDLITGGTYGSGTGVLVLTDRRLLFLRDGVMSKTSEDFPLEKISSIMWSTGMMLGRMTVYASGNKAEINNVQKQDGKAIADAVRSRISRGASASGQQAGAAAPATVGGPDVYEQLKKLAELHAAGVLTDEEFAVEEAASSRSNLTPTAAMEVICGDQASGTFRTLDAPLWGRRRLPAGD